MRRGFVLRFQELVEDEPVGQPEVQAPTLPLSGTQTVTKASGEARDADASSRACLPIPRGAALRARARSVTSCGTKTITEVKTEASDSDPKSYSLRAIPRSGGIR
jgi:hypothetical protein